MKRFLSAFADRLRAKTAIRRKRDLERAAEKMKTREEMRFGPRDWRGEAIDAHGLPHGHRSPRGRDGRRL